MTTEQADVCIVGGGPAGLGFAHEWSRRVGRGRVILLEAGPPIETRTCTVQELRGCRKLIPCEVLSGIGGASGLAGGKLSEFPAGRRLSGLMGDQVSIELERSLELLGPHLPLTPPPSTPELLAAETERFASLDFELRHYRANKYSQADMRHAWRSIAEDAASNGIDIRTNAKVSSIDTSEGVSVVTSGPIESVIEARAVVLATGRSGSDLVAALPEARVGHALDIGVRIEFPAHLWQEMDEVHGDLKLHFGNARTFCTSKSGWISPYRYRDMMLLEGRTDSDAKSPLSNIAITIRTDQPTAAVVEHVRKSVLGQGPGSSVRQPLSDYLDDKIQPRSTRDPNASFSYWRWGDVNALFPTDIAAQVREAVHKFCADVLPVEAAREAFVFGPELDYYWLTVPRETTSGVWPVGDITGEYRGTLQAYTAGRFIAAEVARALMYPVEP